MAPMKKACIFPFQRILLRLKNGYLWLQYQIALGWFSENAIPTNGGRISFEPEPEDPAEAFIRWTITILAQCAPGFMLEASDEKPTVDSIIQAFHIWGLAILCLTADPRQTSSKNDVRMSQNYTSKFRKEQLEGTFSILDPSAALLFAQGDKLKDRTTLGLMMLKETHAFPYHAAVLPGNLRVKDIYHWPADTSKQKHMECARDILNRLFHQSRIRPAITALPSDLQNEQTQSISGNTLLWFMIFLTAHNGGTKWRYSDMLRHSDVEHPTVRFRAGQVDDLFQDEEPTAEEVGLFWKEYLPSAILRSQLGVIETGVSSPHDSPLPVLGLDYGPKLWCHRDLLQVTAHIDNVISLRVGSDMKRMESRGSNDVMEHAIQELFQSRKLLHPRSNSKTYENQFKIGIEHLAWWTIEGDETANQPAILFQFRFHERLRFMGAVTECLRSELAFAYEHVATKTADTEVAKDWVVNAPLPINRYLDFEPGEQLRSMFIRTTEPEELDHKLVQLRTLWECQSHAFVTLRKERQDLEYNAPISLSAMILCILGFPALWMNRPTHKWTKDILHAFEVQPMRAPQEFVLRIDVLDTLVIRMSIGSLASPMEAPQSFNWQLWRDAFAARLEAFQVFQQCRAANTRPVYPGAFTSLRPMNSGIERWTKGFKVHKLWHGWPPFRPAIASFEGAPHAQHQMVFAEALYDRLTEQDTPKKVMKEE